MPGTQKLYIAIKDDLLAKIDSGSYAVGQVIPSEIELAQSYGVSRSTVRQALQLLVEAGYLDRRKRRGTVVLDRAAAQSAGRVPGASETGSVSPMGEAGQAVELVAGAAEGRVRTICLLSRVMEANEQIAELMELPVGTPVRKIVRLRYLDDVPNVFMVTFVPDVPYQGLAEVNLSEQRLYPAMEALGRPVTSAKRRLEATKADMALSAILDVPLDDPLFLFYITGRDAAGEIVELSVTWYRGRDNSLEFATGQ